MMGLWEAMIALQEQALEAQRQQVALATKWMAAGQDAVAAQKQGIAAIETSAKAWTSWLGVWGVKG